MAQCMDPQTLNNSLDSLSCYDQQMRCNIHGCYEQVQSVGKMMVYRCMWVTKITSKKIPSFCNIHCPIGRFLKVFYVHMVVFNAKTIV